MVNIFFDFDGTLLDSFDRLYQLFQDLVPESEFSKSDYWELKRNKVNHQTILEKYFSNRVFEEFNAVWLQKIETPEYLSLDKLKDGAKDVLQSLKDKSHKIFLVTARQDKNELLKELERFKIKNLFDNILVTENKKTKSELIKESLGNIDCGILVGDTGHDINTGKECGLKTVAITDGFLSEDVLKGYKPDYVIKTIVELTDLV